MEDVDDDDQDFSRFVILETGRDGTGLFGLFGGKTKRRRNGNTMRKKNTHTHMASDSPLYSALGEIPDGTSCPAQEASSNPIVTLNDPR